MQPQQQTQLYTEYYLISDSGSTGTSLYCVIFDAAEGGKPLGSVRVKGSSEDRSVIIGVYSGAGKRPSLAGRGSGLVMTPPLPVNTTNSTTTTITTIERKPINNIDSIHNIPLNQYQISERFQDNALHPGHTIVWHGDTINESIPPSQWVEQNGISWNDAVKVCNYYVQYLEKNGNNVLRVQRLPLTPQLLSQIAASTVKSSVDSSSLSSVKSKDFLEKEKKAEKELAVSEKDNLDISDSGTDKEKKDRKEKLPEPKYEQYADLKPKITEGLNSSMALEDAELTHYIKTAIEKLSLKKDEVSSLDKNEDLIKRLIEKIKELLKKKSEDVVVRQPDDKRPPGGDGSGPSSSQSPSDRYAGTGPITGNAGKISQTESNSGESGTPPNQKENQSIEAMSLHSQYVVDTNSATKESDASKQILDETKQKSPSLPIKRQEWMVKAEVQLEKQVTEESRIESSFKI